MRYWGLARKYRPKTFEEVVGQEQIATTLQNAIQSNRVHHAYLFCGSRGVGKTSLARILAKALNCDKGPTIHPCNGCEICTHISTGDDVDVIEIDGASNRGIEEIRNIKENIKYLHYRARYKIYIIE
jgi:DNA polymerase-3 subunit gamma/tau